MWQHWYCLCFRQPCRLDLYVNCSYVFGIWDWVFIIEFGTNMFVVLKHIFIENAVMYVLRFAKEVCDAIVAKCLTGRPKTVEKAQIIFMLWVELEAVDVFLVCFLLRCCICIFCVWSLNLLGLSLLHVIQSSLIDSYAVSLTAQWADVTKLCMIACHTSLTPSKGTVYWN